MNYKTILNTIAVSALGYLPFTNTANASIQETQQPNTANTEYNQLIQEVKKRSGLVSPIILIDEFDKKGSREIIPRYRCSGYNKDLESQVSFEYNGLGGGMLITEIPNSPFVPKFQRGEQQGVSRLYTLIVIEGAGHPIDGKPENVAVEESTQIEKPEGFTMILQRRLLEEYTTDPLIKAGITRDYLTALRKTKLFP